jgi:hypothetical protein
VTLIDVHGEPNAPKYISMMQWKSANARLSPDQDGWRVMDDRSATLSGG